MADCSYEHCSTPLTIIPDRSNRKPFTCDCCDRFIPDWCIGLPVARKKIPRPQSLCEEMVGSLPSRERCSAFRLRTAFRCWLWMCGNELSPRFMQDGEEPWRGSWSVEWVACGRSLAASPAI